jgi:sec-independent protein translocase protein TatA
MGKLFDSPVTLVVLLAVILILFGANRLPGVAKSLGQSMKIFKNEVQDLRSDDAPPAAAPPAAAPPAAATPPPAATAPEAPAADGGRAPNA